MLNNPKLFGEYKYPFTNGSIIHSILNNPLYFGEYRYPFMNGVVINEVCLEGLPRWSCLYSYIWRVWFCRFDQKKTKDYEWSVNQTKVNLPLGFRHCNCWTNHATVPLQALPSYQMLRCTLYCNWWRWLKPQRNASGITTAFKYGPQQACSLYNSTVKALCVGKRSLVIRCFVPE